MINKKMIWKIMGFLLYIEAALILCCSGVSLYYQEDDMDDFLLTAGITTVVGIIFNLMGRNAEKGLNRRDGYLIVSVAWVLFSLFGMLPYRLSGYIPNVADAFFETMSGFTTTGATIINDIEALPHGLLFWRSLTQWVGGLGIVFFTLAVLPVFGVSGVQLFAAEATGVKHDKLHPRIGVTAKWLWSIYLGLTLTETVLLAFGGMSIFDSICHAMATTATGGYSTKQASIAYYQSPYIEYVITIFMFLSGINFTLLFLIFMKGKFQKFFHDAELKWYTASTLILIGITTAVLVQNSSMGLEESFRKAALQVVSLHTTTGFASADYMTWPPVLWTLMGLIFFFGACSGSTTGAIKSIRLVILAKTIANEFKRIVHPNAVLPVRVNSQVVSLPVRSTILAFVALYFILICIGWLALMALGIGFTESLSVVVSAIGNIGPGLGLCGPAYTWSWLPDAAIWILSFLMLVGRLEIFTVLLLFTPSFWKKN